VPNLHLEFCLPYAVSILFPSDPKSHYSQVRLWHFDCRRSDWPVIFTSIAQMCGYMLSMSSRSSVESLSIIIDGQPPPSIMQLYEIDPTPWLQLSHSFSSVQRLSISAALELFIAATLQGLTGESAAHVFPSLHSLTILGDSHMRCKTIPQGIQSFVAARQHFGRPVTLFCS
jgi:hypothetical protein